MEAKSDRLGSPSHFGGDEADQKAAMFDEIAFNIVGTFLSDTSASGTITMTMNSPDAACAANTSTTWSATKL